MKGVLGGLDFLNKIDIEESNKLLTMLYKNPLLDLRVLDCGAGIGSKDICIYKNRSFKGVINKMV